MRDAHGGCLLALLCAFTDRSAIAAPLAPEAYSPNNPSRLLPGADAAAAPAEAGLWERQKEPVQPMRGLNPKADAMADATASAEEFFNNAIMFKNNDTNADGDRDAFGQETEPCPLCGRDTQGVGNCCVAGGSWEGTCTNSPDEPGSEHTLQEGYLSCVHLAVLKPAGSQEAGPSTYREMDGTRVVVTKAKTDSDLARINQIARPGGSGRTAAGRGGPLDPEAGAAKPAEAGAPKLTTFGTGSKAAAAAPTAAANELHEALQAGPADMADATKPSAEHLPLQAEALPDPSKALGVQQRKCDSEREEWCDGFLTANEMAAAMRRVGSALVPGADARGCNAKVDTMGKRFVTDEWCVSSCSMLVPNCPSRLCDCDEHWKPDENEDAPIDLTKPVTPFARAFNANMEKHKDIEVKLKERQEQETADVRAEREAPPETDEQLTSRMKRLLSAVKQQHNSTEVSAVAIISGQVGLEDDGTVGTFGKVDEPPPEELANATWEGRNPGRPRKAKAAAPSNVPSNVASPPSAASRPPPPPPPGKEGWAAETAAKMRQQAQMKTQQMKDRNVTDGNVDCAAWAENGECEKNPVYMTSAGGCALSCQMRSENNVRGSNGWFLAASKELADSRAPAVLVTGGDAPHDEQLDCPKWAAAGECVNNPAFMATSCAVSCQARLDPTAQPPKDLGCEGLDCEEGEEADSKKSKWKGGSVKKEYADSSGFPEEGDPQTCVKVAQVTDEWCRNNCASKPPVCPGSLCRCQKKDKNKKDMREESGACGPMVGIKCGQMYFDNGYTTLKSWDQAPGGAGSPLMMQPVAAQVVQKKSLQEINKEITVPY
jgi:hypothetical protein